MSSQISVLIVDDDNAILMTLETLVSKTFPDLKVYTASNGREAWDIVNAAHPSIVLSDLSMPDMDGMQLLIKIRANESFNDVIFILLTGYTEATDKIKALDRGADEFIAKPIISTELEARMRSAIRIVRMQLKMKEENQLLMALADELEKDVQDMARLSVKFMQARIPTSQETLTRIANASVWMARQLGKFSDEEVRDIEIASFLSQAGRMSLPDHLLKEPVMIDGKPTDHLMMQVPSAAREIVSGIRRFTEVGKILFSIYENFDGTGFPRQLQSWQIPFSSRIIRVAVDYEEIKERTGKRPADVIAILHNFANRLYDKRVVVLIEHYVLSHDKEAKVADEEAMLLSDLKDGMVLTRDIITEKGLKLLPAGAILRTPIILKIIAHNSTDPILGNVYVKRTSAGN